MHSSSESALFFSLSWSSVYSQERAFNIFAKTIIYMFTDIFDKINISIIV